MKHKGFLIWMLGYPVVSSLSELQAWWVGIGPLHYSAEVRGVAALLYAIFYLVVGALLWYDDAWEEA